MCFSVFGIIPLDTHTKFVCRSKITHKKFVFQVKRDMVAIKHELDTVQQVKEEIEELREYVDRLEEHTHRRKLRLLEQVSHRTLNRFDEINRFYYYLLFLYLLLFSTQFFLL